MTPFYEWLAKQCRQFAQWLDPLPDALAELHDKLDTVRQTLSDAHKEMALMKQGVETDLAAMRGEMAKTQDALVALQQQHAHCVPVAHDDLYDKAVQLTQERETKGGGGEFKRKIVYTDLIDAFPQRSRREIALALEAALWR